MTDQNVRDEIETNAEGPKRMKGDQGEVEQHGLADQIAADRYLKGSSAVANKRKIFGAVIGQFKAPGSQ